MNVSAKVDYAAAALVELAVAYKVPGPLCVREITARHAIPQQFLVQILQQLKRAGLITSTRGAAGGYRLARGPERITLAEIVDAVEGSPAVPKQLAGAGGVTRSLHRVWQRVHAAERQILNTTRLDMLVDQSHGQKEPMYHI